MTAHPASSRGHDGQEYVGSEQWRVLRFNTVTRQSVNRVRLRHDGRGHEAAEARPDCLAFPYLRTMAASGARLSRQAALTTQSFHNPSPVRHACYEVIPQSIAPA